MVVVLSGTPTSSTTKTGCHDIAEILLKVALSAINQSIINHIIYDADFVETYCVILKLNSFGYLKCFTSMI
jgi:hypothetical protein